MACVCGRDASIRRRRGEWRRATRLNTGAALRLWGDPRRYRHSVNEVKTPSWIASSTTCDLKARQISAAFPRIDQPPGLRPLSRSGSCPRYPSIYAEPVQARGTACRIRYPFSEGLPRSLQATWSATAVLWAWTRPTLRALKVGDLPMFVRAFRARSLKVCR